MAPALGSPPVVRNANGALLNGLSALVTHVLQPRSERRVLRRLVGASGTAILAGRGARHWGEAVKALHPGAHLYYPDARELGRLDEYCAARGIRHVDLLTLDAPAAALAGAKSLLEHARIDVIACAGAPPLEGLPYRLFRAGARALKPVEAHQARGGRIIAIHERLLPLVLDLPKTMLDLAALCRAYGIVPRGVVHVGAHEGREWEDYRRMGVSAALFIEANPAVFARLQAKLGASPGVTLANVAIAATSGPVTLHVTSSDQSSSILPLHRHSDYYPTIVETETVVVPGRSLDDLFAELGLAAERFNLLNIDIQGAELQALSGATGLLAHIEGINVEVNFEELYRGCAQVEELDALLEARGFRRVATICPFHKSWGDAFYARDRRARPV